MCSECYISALFQLDYWFSSTRVFGKFVWNDLSWKILPFGNTNNCCAGVKNLTFLICVLRFMYCCKEGGFEMSFVKKIFNFWGTYNCCAGVKDLVFFFFFICVLRFMYCCKEGCLWRLEMTFLERFYLLGNYLLCWCKRLTFLD